MAVFDASRHSLIRPGDRVLVSAHWSSFYGYRGVVIETRPHLMIRLDGDRLPMRFGEREVTQEPETVSMTGAE